MNRNLHHDNVTLFSNPHNLPHLPAAPQSLPPPHCNTTDILHATASPTTSSVGTMSATTSPASSSTLRPRRRPPPSLWSEVNTSIASLTSSLTSAPPKSPTPPPSPLRAEILVYVYPVTPSTTLQGVVIAFDTTASSILRTNALWPGDVLQSRRELLIPVDDCRIRGTPLPPLEEEMQEKRYRVHSCTLLPNNIGPTTIGVLLPRRAKRRKPPPVEEVGEGEERPKWMTPGVHSFHPEMETRLPEVEWGEMVRGAEVVGGKVEGWVRKIGEGLRGSTVGGELIEMVSGLEGGAGGGRRKRKSGGDKDV